MQCKGHWSQCEGCAAPERKNLQINFAINHLFSSIHSFSSILQHDFGGLQTGHRLTVNINGSNRTNADLAAVELRCQAFFMFNELGETERMNNLHTKICR